MRSRSLSTPWENSHQNPSPLQPEHRSLDEGWFAPVSFERCRGLQEAQVSDLMEAVEAAVVDGQQGTP